ncbi:MAG TPA: M43 family zinc metalloprotease [Chitinophagaceae bacterium]|nr:M43 family zinc metalloprotease [Chitinophagaceae bacterium]
MLQKFTLFSVSCILFVCTYGQQPSKQAKCATDYILKKMLERNPSVKKAYLQSEKVLAEKMLQLIKAKNSSGRTLLTVNVPVVFHVVLSNQSLVSDAVVLQQLDVLNKDFSGMNADSVNIPSDFKPLFGKSGIQFCLAKQSPEGEPTNGINRVVSSTKSMYGPGDPVKHDSKGGSDAWDPEQYLNIWITDISDGGILGYSSIAGTNVFPPDEDGVVVSYKTLPGGSIAAYNLGRTAVHEVGHYFRLLHIWGDDNGACSGTDFPDMPSSDDTPNQTDATFGCPSGVKTDFCSPSAPGIMYQNYMDYTDDACMAMFSSAQASRMEAAVNAFRPGLLTSNGCNTPVLLNRNIIAKKITYPVTNICTTNFQPTVVIKNIGTATVTSLKLTALIDGNNAGTTNWTGSLASLAQTIITLNPVSGAVTGNHELTIYTSMPNGSNDEDVTNDTTKSNFVFPNIVQSPLKEGFENNSFPPAGWTLSNPDNYITWERTTAASKSGAASAFINNFDYSSFEEKDLLITPLFPVQNVDSTFLTFQLAAATYTDPGSIGIPLDTLEVLITADCGASFTSVYKKWGKSLVTRADTVNGLQTPFIPTASEWRKDSVYLSPYLNGLTNIQVVFKNTTNYENNIYIDDVNLYNIVVNPILKSKGLLVTPNPFTDRLIVQHYPNPSTLKAIAIYNSLGQLVSQRNFALGSASTYIEFNLSGMQPGLYFVKIFYTDKQVTEKIIKAN